MSTLVLDSELSEVLDLCLTDPFLSSTGNVSDEFRTEITPAGWTFAIWSIIYVFLALVLLFVISGICRRYVTYSTICTRQIKVMCVFLVRYMRLFVVFFFRNAYGYVYCSPPVLPHGFFIAWCLNLGLNVGWLFLWDRRFKITFVFFTV